MVNCTYADSPQRLKPLPGTAKDAKAMLDTFNHLNYVVHQLVDPSREQLLQKVTQVSNYLQTCKIKDLPEEKVIIFAFSGHGTAEDVIYANDGLKIQLEEEIKYPLTMPEAVAQVPKLFLIDACRGIDVISRRCPASEAAADRDTKSDDLVSKVPRRAVGNYYTAYATVPDHVCFETSSGSLWMPKLAKTMWDEKNESFQNIVAKVTKEVSKFEGQHQERQQSNAYDTLNVGPLYLQKKLE